MSAARQVTPLAALLCTVVITACAGGGDGAADSAHDSASGTAPAASSASGTAPSLSQMAGKWNLRAVPESGADTTPTNVVLTATADTTGWTMTFPGQPPVPLKVRVSGDSIVTESEPYNSTRRAGVKVRTTGSMRMQGDSIYGITIARYEGAGADSVLRMRTTGKRAP